MRREEQTIQWPTEQCNEKNRQYNDQHNNVMRREEQTIQRPTEQCKEKNRQYNDQQNNVMRRSIVCSTHYIVLLVIV
jgi:hypothetical protein